jgi:hypothetical protein
MGLDHSPLITTDGLMVYLDAANTRSYPGTGNTWYDLKGNRNFNLINNPPFIANSAGGSIGFTAANSHNATANSLPLLTTWTVEVWIFHTGLSTGTYPAIICERYNNTTLNFALFSPNYSVSNFQLQTGYYTSNNWFWTNEYAIAQNNWYHAVGTYDGSNVKLYVNSVLQLTTASTTAPTKSDLGIYLMRRWDSPDFYGGSLNTVKIYNRALTSQEIVQNYNATKKRYGL